MTLMACEQRCPGLYIHTHTHTHQYFPVFRNPCATGEPARQPGVNSIVTCSVRNLNTCPASFWCHVGADEQTTLCCPGGEY
jgi:hypothetical protein